MTFLQQLEHKLSQKLPGPKAQYKMAHAIRKHVPSPPPDVRIASVLLTLFPYQGDWYTLLIQRTGTDIRDKHKGQISFPGGKQEEEDTSLAFTALREAEEEVGLPTDKVQILGRLTELYIPVSNFIVHPFVGAVLDKPEWIPQPSEVADILEVPLNTFSDPQNQRIRDISIAKNMVLKNVPYYNIQGKIVWGATAMMMSEFLEVLEQAKFS